MQTMHGRERRWATILYALVLTGGGCYGGLDGKPGEGADGADGGGDGADGNGDAGDDANGDAGDGVAGDESPAPTTRVARLTHEQWENTVRDLFYLSETTGLSENFRADPQTSGYAFDNNALSLEVDQALWSGYRIAAADAAELATADATIMSAILPPDGGDNVARADQFIREFGRRAFRRPLDEAEVSVFMAEFNQADALYSDEAAFEAGVRIVIETMLQSPDFLYRVETSEEVVGDVIPLSDYEVAQRMSYFLWNTMPDDTLLDVADAAGLSTAEDVANEAWRMLADPRAGELIGRFNDQLFHVEKFETVAPSATFYPDAPADLGISAVTEFRMFMNEMMLGREGTFADVLTSTETFVNADLAAIYGVPAPAGGGFELVQLDPNQRKGILTQIGFLAANSSSVNPDPIHRGVFVSRDMLCTPIAAPPDNVPPAPPPMGKSNRETVAEHTSEPSCAGCHTTLINPYGFAFENYDAVGAWRDMDDVFPVDASGAVAVGSAGAVDIDNALDLIDAMATSPEVHGCYLEHLIEYANGRPKAPEDEELVTRLAELSVAEASVQALIVELVTSKPFLSRATEELQ